MYKIEGDGSWRNTKVWRDGVQVNYHICHIIINSEECLAIVDGESGLIEQILLKGVYVLIGLGRFDNTRLFIFDELLRGIQSISLLIAESEHSVLSMDIVFLPNIIEVEG